jgi:hypothetical protein
MIAAMKILGFSVFLAFVSLAIPFSGTNMVWVNDADYSFLTQVALPHLGITTSSVIGGYAGVLYLRSSENQTLHQIAGIYSGVAIIMLISGLLIIDRMYVFMYSLACPPLVGFGVEKLAEHLPSFKKRGVTFTLIGLLIVPSIALLCIGINSVDWVMVIDFGTGLRVLFGALIGGLAAKTNLQGCDTYTSRI